LQVHWAGEQETELIILIEEGENSGVISTLPGGSLALLKRLDTGQSTPVSKPVTGGWLQLGFHHVMGADHILFILGLFLLAPRWRELLKQSLLFTLAHSLTLGLAVFGLINVPSVWVEHLIALSIAWIGIENLIIRKLCKQRLIFVFGFGLLHGLGFASVLTAKLEGVSRNELLGPLLGFNVGVEIAQICILCMALALLWPMREYSLEARKYGSVFIAIAGLAWLAQRLFFPNVPLF
jgi:hydrogenase/urease accessory protein HupE